MGTRRRPKGGADGEGVKLLYLAGPFGAPEGDPDPLHTVNENILAASRIALEAARAGWMPVCPHKNSAGFQHCPDLPVEFWYEGDIALMLRCDAVLMLPRFSTSKGALAELDTAKAAGMGIYYYEEFGEVPDPHESFWSGPVDRTSTADLVEEIWHRVDAVSGMMLGDDDRVIVREGDALEYRLSTRTTAPAVVLVVDATAYAPRPTSATKIGASETV